MDAATIRWEQWQEQREMTRSLLYSVIAHILLILGIGIAVQSPALRTKIFPEKTEVEEIILTLVAPEPTPDPEKIRRFINTPESRASEKTPEQSKFESDKNTLAASQSPATGRQPMPTQDGIQAPGIVLENRQHTEGEQPSSRPNVVTNPDQAPPPPRERKTPAPTPPLRPAAELALLDIARRRPLSTPVRQLPQEDKQPQKSIETAETGYQPEQRITRITGGIGDPGVNSVAATATPLGKYRQQICDAIGQKWHIYIKREISLVNPGTAKIRFTVRPNGKVEKIKLLQNSSNVSLEVISAKAIADAAVPPIPSDLLTVLEGERIEMDFTFTILSH